MLHHIVTVGLLYAIITYQVLVESQHIFSGNLINNLFYLTYTSWELFVFTMRGEELKASSLAITDSIYNSMWYHLRYHGIHMSKYKSFRASIMLTMVRANREIVIKAGGIFDLSYETFTKVRWGCH